jgi:hypothetical protein
MGRTLREQIFNQAGSNEPKLFNMCTSSAEPIINSGNVLNNLDLLIEWRNSE